MDHEDFRTHGHALVDWLADHFRDLERQRIVPAVTPGAIRAAFPAAAPEEGAPFEAIFAEFEQTILPGMSHWGHPGWMAYFPSNGSPPSLLAEFLATGLGAQCMSWITSPAATELEQVTMAWLRDLLGLPAHLTGVIQDTASSSTLVAVLTARERLGDAAARMTAYCSSEAHSSVRKAFRLAAIPEAQVRVLPVDAAFAFRPEPLAEALAADRAAGLVPGIVVATTGTTSSTACDPLRALGTLAREAGAWFHVDAAYAGTAAICPELRPMLDGVELADSVVTNPHKWLLTHFDCSAYYVRDVEALVRTFRTAPEYLRTAQDAEVVNFRDWGIPLGRRFRALKLWVVLRSYGATAIRAMIREHVALGRELAGWVDAEPGWERLAPAPLGLVCLRHVPPALVGDEAALAEHNAALLARVNAAGDLFLTHTILDGRYAIRVAIGSFRTERRHVERAWELLRGAG